MFINKLKSITKFKYFYQSLIFLAILVLSITNFPGKSYLLGWDSLSSELAPWLAVKRAFFAGWQEYQSFGLASGMAHAADILRALFGVFLSLILPKNLVRYIFTLLMLLIGGLGAFRFLKFSGFEDKKHIAFIGALFYMLNFGTFQMFSIPFEPFSVFFAFLPWEIYAFLRFVESPKEQNVFLLFLTVNILATPQAYTQPLFVVYFVTLGLISLGILILDFSWSKAKVLLLAFSSIVVINAFWILPQIYFVSTSLNVVSDSKINQLATQTVNFRNLNMGTIPNLTRFEGFYFDLYDSDRNLLFGSVKSFFDSDVINVLSYYVFLIILIGFIFSVKKFFSKKPKEGKVFELVFLFSYLFFTLAFLGKTFPISYIHEFLSKVPFLSQVFRSPFTKFVFVSSLFSSFYLCVGINYIIIFLKRTVATWIIRFFYIALIGLLFVNSLPLFKGNLFLPQVRREIPQEYLEVMDYFENVDKNSRIALLPDYTFWGWYNTDWGYDGSGFIWYGIEQPTVSRTFDVWSNESESYFWEIKDAIESRNVSLFESVLRKYNVEYLILDTSLEPISAIVEGLQYDQLEEIFTKSTLFNKVYDHEKLQVYHFVEDKSNIKSGVSLAQNVPNIGPSAVMLDRDYSYTDFGTYLTADNTSYDAVYPFRDFFTQNSNVSKNYTLEEIWDSFKLCSKDLALDNGPYMLFDDKDLLKVKLFDGNDIRIFDLAPEIKVSLGEAIVTIDRNKIYEANLPVDNFQNCINGLKLYKVTPAEGGVATESWRKGAVCFAYDYPFLAHWNGYIVKAVGRNITGDSLHFYIVGNKNRNQSKNEAKLTNGVNYFILPRGNYYEDGYNLGFQNLSYEHIPSSNVVNSLEIFAFPVDYVKSLHFVSSGSEVRSAKFSKDFDVTKNTYYRYEVSAGDSSYDTLILYQAYDPGWMALCGLKRCAAKHVMVNNWANGWVFESSMPESMQIIFWPQFLEYLGFFLAFVSLLGSVVYIRIRRDKLSNET